jgi:hypothetical protein
MVWSRFGGRSLVIVIALDFSHEKAVTVGGINCQNRLFIDGP